VDWVVCCCDYSPLTLVRFAKPEIPSRFLRVDDALAGVSDFFSYGVLFSVRDCLSIRNPSFFSVIRSSHSIACGVVASWRCSKLLALFIALRYGVSPPETLSELSFPPFPNGFGGSFSSWVFPTRWSDGRSFPLSFGFLFFAGFGKPPPAFSRSVPKYAPSLAPQFVFFHPLKTLFPPDFLDRGSITLLLGCLANLFGRQVNYNSHPPLP